MSGSVITVQCGLCLAVSFITVQYKLFLVVPFITVQCELYLELCLAVSLLCNVSCFSVCKLFPVGSYITV